jgi:hypothetical protein
MKRAGHCHCGQVSFVIDDEAKELDICHCKNCQLQSGSAYAPFLAVASSKLTILGMPKCFNDQDTVSGRVVRRHFCGDCGSPVYVTVERAPNTAYVFSGLLDQTHDLRPKVHGWTATKHAWVDITEGGEQYKMDPGLSSR